MKTPPKKQIRHRFNFLGFPKVPRVKHPDWPRFHAPSTSAWPRGFQWAEVELRCLWRIFILRNMSISISIRTNHTSKLSRSTWISRFEQNTQPCEASMDHCWDHIEADGVVLQITMSQLSLSQNPAAVNSSDEPSVAYDVTALRKDSSYIIYYQNWFCLFSTGVLPMVALVYLNVNIYRKVVRNRWGRWCLLRTTDCSYNI